VAIIRQIEARDAAAFVGLSEKLDAETKLMLFEPGERLFTPGDQARRIAAMHAEGSTQVVFVAELSGGLVGFLGATAGSAQRTRHTASLTLGVLRSCWGKGIGSSLLDALAAWAKAKDLHRLELSVLSHNLRAVNLYLRHGFVVEGTRKHALRVDSAYFDEYWMGRLL